MKKIQCEQIGSYKPKYVALLSGGLSSGKVAVNAARKKGKENVILLNHDLSPEVEDEDIKRFKNEIADEIGLEITYANHPDWENMSPLDVCLDIGYDTTNWQNSAINRKGGYDKTNM